MLCGVNKLEKENKLKVTEGFGIIEIQGIKRIIKIINFNP
jgi:hypothetical protein